MKYKNYYNFELGNRDIYSRNDILGMTVQDLFDNELPLSYQYNTIGIPKDDELIASPNTHQYTNANGKLRWRSSSKTTEELLEEERQRRAEQEAQTANAQSQLSGFGNTTPQTFSAPKQAVESPMLESEPLVDSNTMQNFKSLLQNRKQNDNVVSPVSNAIKSNVPQQHSLMEAPDYYEENLPVYQEEELWDDLNDYLKPDLIPQTNNDEVLTNEQPNNNDKTIIKGSVEEVVNPYDLIQNDTTLSTEEKVAKIKELTDARNKEIDKEHRKNMSRILGGAAIDIGANFIPGTIGLKAVKGLTKAMSPITKMLVPRLGKKISNKLIQNAAESIVSEPIGSIGQSIENGEDIITESTASDILQDMTKDMVMNSVLPFYRKYNKGKVLKNIDNFDNLSKYQKRRMQDKYMQYYDDYVEGTTKHKKPKARPSHQLRDKEWLEWLRKAKLRR